jgi:arylsulfatase A-like enzyme
VIGPAIAGAVLAAVAIGLGEAALVAVERGIGFDLGLLGWALAAYGAVGLVAGIGIGIALALVLRGRVAGATAHAVAGGAVFAVLATVIGRFLVVRDVFHESFHDAPISPMAFQLASLGAFLLFFLLAYLALRVLVDRQRLAASPVVVVGAVALLTAGALAGAGAGTAPHGKPAPLIGQAPKGPNVILIAVDTLRADHLSTYGYGKSQTPAIDALAADGTRFAKAYAQASWTRPSFATIFTSLYPSSHQAVHKSDILPDGVVTLAEVMQAGNYRTAAFVNNINIAPLFNFQQGFDEYVFLEPSFFFGASEAAAQLTIYNQLRLVRERYLSDVKHVENYYQPAEVVTDRGLDWIARNGDRPFFLMVHYMDPHDPYFDHPWNGKGLARVANPNPDASLADAYKAAYDGEIRYLDGEIARFVDGLKKSGVYDKSVIILTADHGEEFHEHGGWWHGQTLYEEQIAVPLLERAPGGPRGAVNEALVSSLDIAPTALALAGVPVPEGMQGRPLGLEANAPAPRDHVFAESALEGNVLTAYRNEEWKLLEANPGNPRGLPPQQLFDVATDPHEQHDVAASKSDVASTLAANLSAVQSHAETVAVTGAETEVDPATRERLKALGYVH